MNFILKSISLLGLSLIFVSFSQCGSSQNTTSVFEEDPPFEIKESYFQKWVAGVQGGGSGINLHTTFSSIDEVVTLNRVFFRKQSEKLMKNRDHQYTGYFKTSQNQNRTIIMDSDPVKESKNIPSENYTFNLEDNEAVISYFYKNKTYFYKITNIIEKPMIAYPGAKPN